MKDARKEAKEQLLRRDQRAVRLRKQQELLSVERLLDDRDHPVWWALAFILLPHVEPRDDESLHGAVVRIVREHGDRVLKAFTAAKAPFALKMFEGLSGEPAARPNETEETALTRILLERGASAHEAVRIAGGYGDHVHSAGLPQQKVRAANRLAARLRSEAAQKHGKLVNVVVPHGQILVGRPTDLLADGVKALLDEAVRREEKRQATIVRNIDSRHAPSSRSKRRIG